MPARSNSIDIQLACNLPTDLDTGTAVGLVQLATVLVVNQEAAVRHFLKQAGLRVVEVQLGEPVVACTKLSDPAGSV
jgi:hypothetical protein